MNNTKTLLDLKEKIETGKVRKDKLEGQREEAMKTLKEDFKCKGLKSAKRELATMEKEVEKDTKALNKQIEKLAEKIGGN